jgi:hypothetical protein
MRLACIFARFFLVDFASGQTPASQSQLNLPVPQKPTVFVVLLLLASSAAAQRQPAQEPSTGIPSSGQRSSVTPYVTDDRPLTGKQRFQWFAQSTLGPETLVAGLFSAGFGTAINRPTEYGPHWAGFGKRNAIRLTGTSTSNAMEAALGSVWGEDPRYFRAAGQPFKSRLKNVAVMTFAVRQSDGTLAPAYARYLGKTGSNFVSNSWRADSESGAGDACIRIVLGFAGKMGSNAFAEFWPDARKYLFHRH